MKYDGGRPGDSDEECTDHAVIFLRRVALVCSAVTTFVGAAALAGWVFDWLILARIGEGYIPMAPSTALSFIILSVALAAHVHYPAHRLVRMLAKACLIIVLSFCSLILIEYLAAMKLDIELLLTAPRDVGNIIIGRMSPVTASNFLLSAAAILLMLISRKASKNISSILGIIVALVGLVLILDYLYNTLILYGRLKIPVALNTSIAFMTLGTGITAGAGRHSWPVRLLTGSSVRARLLRLFLPVTIAMTLGYGWLNTVIFSRIISPSMTSALTAILSIMIVSFVVSRISKIISVKIDRLNMEREQAAKALTESEKKFRAIFENAMDGMLLADPESKMFVMSNKTISQMVGYTEKEIAGLGIMDIHPAGDLPFVIEQFERQARGEITVAVDIPVKRKDGSVFYADISATPILLQGRKCLMGIFRDTTERKRLEAQLIQSQKLEAVGQLAGGIAHDFNNILTAIIGYASIAQMKMKQDDPVRHNIEQVLASAERAANLTQSLLAFSRKQINYLAPIDLNETVRKIDRLLSRVIGEDIELRTELFDGRLTVMADHGQIEQVLMNLATNARDAMPSGGLLTIETGKIEIDEEYIKAHGYGKAGTYALISVTDSGVGMDEKTREKIFEPFFTTKEIGKGTGLGLSIVYGIIKQHNGYINCYSEAGKGTTFKIYLPLIKAEEAKKIKTIKPETAGTGTEIILLAEDEEEVRRLTRMVLEESGYKVIEAKDGEEAVNKYIESKDSIQLLLLDVIMPKMNGKEVYDRIKKLNPGIKVLFSSGYPADFIRKDDIVGKGLAFVSKPISPTELLKKVREALDK
ncbi:MAG: PAS domain S-box protein [Nitrospirae bacterium]|nr:PAS domain S-box protein [Nitrospirota bacterium]